MTRPSPAERAAERAAKSERTRRRTDRATDRARLDAVARALRGEAPQGHPTVEDYRVTALINQPSFAEVTVSTARRGRAVGKTGDMLSPLYLAFVRGLRCGFCDAPPESDAHHFPAKGALGYQCDVLTVPACRGVDGDNCHGKCQRFAIPRDRQFEALGRTLAAFCAQPVEFKARVLDELRGGL